MRTPWCLKRAGFVDFVSHLSGTFGGGSRSHCHCIAHSSLLQNPAKICDLSINIYYWTGSKKIWSASNDETDQILYMGNWLSIYHHFTILTTETLPLKLARTV